MKVRIEASQVNNETHIIDSDADFWDAIYASQRGSYGVPSWEEHIADYELIRFRDKRAKNAQEQAQIQH